VEVDTRTSVVVGTHTGVEVGTRASAHAQVWTRAHVQGSEHTHKRKRKLWESGTFVRNVGLVCGMAGGSS
jgi:hypothetical protein